MAERVENVAGERGAVVPTGMREVRLTIPDSRDPEVRKRVSEEVKQLDPADEADVMRWIEAVASLDETG